MSVKSDETNSTIKQQTSAQAISSPAKEEVSEPKVETAIKTPSSPVVAKEAVAPKVTKPKEEVPSSVVELKPASASKTHILLPKWINIVANLGPAQIATLNYDPNRSAVTVQKTPGDDSVVFSFSTTTFLPAGINVPEKANSAHLKTMLQRLIYQEGGFGNVEKFTTSPNTWKDLTSRPTLPAIPPPGAGQVKLMETLDAMIRSFELPQQSPSCYQNAILAVLNGMYQLMSSFTPSGLKKVQQAVYIIQACIRAGNEASIPLKLSRSFPLAWNSLTQEKIVTLIRTHPHWGGATSHNQKVESVLDDGPDSESDFINAMIDTYQTGNYRMPIDVTKALIVSVCHDFWSRRSSFKSDIALIADCHDAIKESLRKANDFEVASQSVKDRNAELSKKLKELEDRQKSSEHFKSVNLDKPSTPSSSSSKGKKKGEKRKVKIQDGSDEGETFEKFTPGKSYGEVVDSDDEEAKPKKSMLNKFISYLPTLALKGIAFLVRNIIIKPVLALVSLILPQEIRLGQLHFSYSGKAYSQRPLIGFFVKFFKSRLSSEKTDNETSNLPVQGTASGDSI
jgi:hypothetical protein